MSISRGITTEPFEDEIRDRYLHYALSVVKGRALPDVRDGLKPVQRRILYAMWHDLSLTSDQPHRKSASVVGSAMSAYHPHSDQAIYDALVKMSQDFSTNYPLIDGYGNFGSIDGDGAAAMRYTESRLTPIASEIMDDLKDETVPMQENYDQTSKEPEVLPTRVPLVLVNGSVGIAVGMSTSIPPHNLNEICDACIERIQHDATADDLVGDVIEGPDFPLGGTIIDDESDLVDIYREGSGSVTVRSEYHIEDQGRSGDLLVFDSIPFQVNKERVVDSISDAVINDDLPQVHDVRDESADDVRIVIDLKRASSEEAVLAYLFEETALEDTFNINLTCLRPKQGYDELVPEQMNLGSILDCYIDFRMNVIRRRLEHELDGLERRIHLLNGYKDVFDGIDEAIDIIQSSSDRDEAKDRLHDAFSLDDRQASSILRSNLSRLLEGERDDVLDELAEKTDRRDEVQDILSDRSERQEILVKELRRIATTFGRDRRTSVHPDAPDYTFDERMFIEEEEVELIVSRGGWTSYQGSYSSLDTLYVKDQDEIGWALHTTTKETALFFTNRGRVYTERVHELPSTTGYGNPIQGRFDFDNGEQIVSVMTSDELDDNHEIVAICSDGKGVRVDASRFVEPSTVLGRKFKKLGDGAEMLNASMVQGGETISVVTSNGRINVFSVGDISFVKSRAKGVKCIDLDDDDRVIACHVYNGREGNLEVETSNGARRAVTEGKYDKLDRTSSGHWMIKRGSIDAWIRSPVQT